MHRMSPRGGSRSGVERKTDRVEEDGVSKSARLHHRESTGTDSSISVRQKIAFFEHGRKPIAAPSMNVHTATAPWEDTCENDRYESPYDLTPVHDKNTPTATSPTTYVIDPYEFSGEVVLNDERNTGTDEEEIPLSPR